VYAGLERRDLRLIEERFNIYCKENDFQKLLSKIKETPAKI
jgi:hypothetical protein